jgi:hypothetical protein
MECVVKRRLLGYPFFEAFFLLLVLIGIVLAVLGQLKIWILDE